MISVRNLTYSYNRKEKILKGLNMNVPKGAIYGFLGANGAGKSTTIRTILGLLNAQEGSISVFDQDLTKSKVNVYSRIGSLIEAPSFYGNLSARANLKIAARNHHIPYSKISEVLDKVNLAYTGKKKVSNFSMGMKQRLGLAISIMHDPELLILDEPVNGLDPNGISEIRQIIHRLNEEGKTILLSSHLLSEIEKIATHVGILNGGQMVFEGRISELSTLQKSGLSLSIKLDDATKAQKLLNNYEVSIVSQNELTLAVSSENDIPAILSSLVGNGFLVYELKQVRDNLENIFIDITSEKTRS